MSLPIWTLRRWQFTDRTGHESFPICSWKADVDVPELGTAVSLEFHMQHMNTWEPVQER